MLAPMSASEDVLEQRIRRFTEGALLPVLLKLALPVILSITLALMVTLAWFTRSRWQARQR